MVYFLCLKRKDFVFRTLDIHLFLFFFFPHHLYVWCTYFAETVHLSLLRPEKVKNRTKLNSASDLHLHFFTFDSLVERSLGKFVDEKKAQLLKDKSLPVEGCALVAGRTDKGVTALRQVCSFCMLYYH